MHGRGGGGGQGRKHRPLALAQPEEGVVTRAGTGRELGPPSVGSQMLQTGEGVGRSGGLMARSSSR